MALARRQLLRASLAAAAAGTVAPLLAKEVRGWTRVVDVVIAGSGAGGVCAAIEARRAGLDVLVIESQAALGGSTAMSGGVVYLGAGTALQKALGFDDSAEAMAAFITAASRHPDYGKVALYCEESPSHFDWLVANGVSYNERFSPGKERPEEPISLFYSGGERGYPFREMAVPAPRGHVPAVRGRGGAALITSLTGTARSLGVQFMTSAPLERLILESDGRIAGVAYQHSGTLNHIRTRCGVVLACGGFIHNRAMTMRHAPVLHDCVPLAGVGDIGTGIRLAEGLGAATARLHEGFAILPLYPPERLLRGIIINRYGQRFVAEDSYYGVIGHNIAYLQHGTAYLIADVDCALDAGDNKFPERGRGTLADLAMHLQLSPDALEATMAYYNSHCEQGRDPQLHKASEHLSPLRPPFVAYDLSVGSTYFPAHTFGGLCTDIDSRVLHVDGEAIPGLYAAGRTARGLPTAPYMASGLSLGDATFFGRRAGRHLAKRGPG